MKVVSHQGGPSSAWSLIRMVFDQGGLSSVWSLIKVVSNQDGLSCISVAFHQGGLIKVVFYQGFHYRYV